MTEYAKISDLAAVELPTVDVTAAGLRFQLAAITRAQLKTAVDNVGKDDDGNLLDAEEADILMLIQSIVKPALDATNPEHLDLLRDLPIGEVKVLTDAMMILSGLRDEDPT